MAAKAKTDSARRTMVVLGTLIGSMTLAGALLLAMEPGSAGGIGAISLHKLDPGTPFEGSILDTRPRLAIGAWGAIAIHFSGDAAGSAAALDAQHQRLGLESLAYHFVIGNGQGSDDGQTEIGPRWRQQQAGLSGSQPGQSGGGAGAGRVIDICLVGDGNLTPPTDAQVRELVALVGQLQGQLGIPTERVLLYTDPSTGRGRLFPVERFRQELAAATQP